MIDPKFKSNDMDKEFLIEPRFKTVDDLNVADVDEQKEDKEIGERTKEQETVERAPTVDKTTRPEHESGE